jgi:O-antigen ligase
MTPALPRMLVIRLGARRWVGLPVAVGAALVVALGGPMVSVLIGATALLGLAFVWAPGALLAVYLLSGIYKAPVQPYSPIDITVLLALFNAGQVVPMMRNGLPRQVSRPGIALMLLVGFLYLAGALYAPDQGIALRDAATYLLLIVAAILPAAWRVGSDPRYIRQFLWTVFAFGCLMVLAGIAALSSVQRLEVFGASTIEVSRAALLVPIVGMAFVLGQGGPPVRAATIVLIPLALIVAVAAGSRGPLIALAIVVIAGFGGSFLRPGGTTWRAGVLIVGIVTVSIIAFAALGNELPTVSTSRFGLFEDFLARLVGGDPGGAVADTSASRRVALFDVAGQMFVQRPLIGFGTGAFAAISPRYLAPPYEAWPHNSVLQFAAEFGVIGVGLFIGLVIVVLRRPLPGASGGALRALVTFFLLNSLVSDDIYGARPTWGLVAVVLLVTVPAASRAAATGIPRPSSLRLRAAEPTRVRQVRDGAARAPSGRASA